MLRNETSFDKALTVFNQLGQPYKINDTSDFVELGLARMCGFTGELSYSVFCLPSNKAKLEARPNTLCFILGMDESAAKQMVNEFNKKFPNIPSAFHLQLVGVNVLIKRNLCQRFILSVEAIEHPDFIKEFALALNKIAKDEYSYIQAFQQVSQQMGVVKPVTTTEQNHFISFSLFYSFEEKSKYGFDGCIFYFRTVSEALKTNLKLCNESISKFNQQTNEHLLVNKEITRVLEQEYNIPMVVIKLIMLCAYEPVLYGENYLDFSIIKIDETSNRVNLFFLPHYMLNRSFSDVVKCYDNVIDLLEGPNHSEKQLIKIAVEKYMIQNQVDLSSDLKPVDKAKMLLEKSKRNAQDAKNLQENAVARFRGRRYMEERERLLCGARNFLVDINSWSTGELAVAEEIVKNASAAESFFPVFNAVGIMMLNDIARYYLLQKEYGKALSSFARSNREMASCRLLKADDSFSYPNYEITALTMFMLVINNLQGIKTCYEKLRLTDTIGSIENSKKLLKYAAVDTLSYPLEMTTDQVRQKKLEYAKQVGFFYKPPVAADEKQAKSGFSCVIQ